MIKTNNKVKELWEEATSSYLEWSGSDWPEEEWIRRAKSTLNRYKEYLKLSVGQPAEIKCRAQIGRALFDGATHLGENQRIAQEGLDKLVNASRSAIELERALLLDAQRGVRYFDDDGQQELYLPILEGFWTLQADYLENAEGIDEALFYLKKKMTLLEYLNGSFMASACNQLGILHAKKKRDELAFFWFQKAVQAANSCRSGSAIYEFYQGIKDKARENIEIIKPSPALAKKNDRLKNDDSPVLIRKNARSTGMIDMSGSRSPMQKKKDDISNFSFKRDFRFIRWKETLLLNLVRATLAGLVLLIFGIMTGAPPDAISFWIVPFFPIFYLLIFLPIGLICGFLSDIGVPHIGLVRGCIALFVVIGDPLVFILHKIAPKLVPVEKYGFLNFTMMIFVLN